MSRIVFTATNEETGARVHVIRNSRQYTVQYTDDTAADYMPTAFACKGTAIRHALISTGAVDALSGGI